LNVSQAHCRLAKAWQAKGNIAVGLAVVQSQLQEDPANQALNTLQVRVPCGLHSIHQQVLSHWLQHVTAKLTTAMELMKSLQLSEFHKLNRHICDAQNKPVWRELNCVACT